jgi:hypothetical protein
MVEVYSITYWLCHKVDNQILYLDLVLFVVVVFVIVVVVCCFILFHFGERERSFGEYVGQTHVSEQVFQIWIGKEKYIYRRF